MRELINMEFDSVKFSFKGVDYENYCVMRQREDFETLIETIRKFKQLRGNNALLFITIGTSLTNESDEKVRAFREVCDEGVCD